MITQYLRKWSMMVNGEPFIDSRDGHQLRCVFDIDVNPDNSLVQADIRLYNLSKQTTIEQRSDIIFSAGYQDKHDTIFIGTVTNILKERHGPDVVTRLLCVSGRAAERGMINSGYRAGAKLTDVLADAARAWPLYLEIDHSHFDDKDVFPAGWTAHGDIPKVLDSLAEMFKFRWVTERGSLIITRPDRQRSTTMYDVNQFTGMVGQPELDRGIGLLGVKVTTRINPYIRATSRINLQSEFATYASANLKIAEQAGDASASGEYNVFRLRYTGDSHGDRWDMRIDAIRATTSSPANGSQAVDAEVSGGGLVWGRKVTPEFRAKVREISDRLGIDPNWLMSVMAFETGESFAPWEPNRAGSGATGLIQFTRTTARGLGTSTQELARMTAVQQLDWVEKYLKPYAPRVRNLGDLYMAVFMPAKGIGVPDSTVLIDQATQPNTYHQNGNLDMNHDGKITRGEAISRVHDAYKKGKQHMV